MTITARYTLTDGTVLGLDDGKKPGKVYDKQFYEGSVILCFLNGSVSQVDASRAAGRTVGVRAVASLRRVTLESKRIKKPADAVDIAQDFAVNMDIVLKLKASGKKQQQVSKSNSRSTTTVRRRTHRPQAHRTQQ